MSDTTGGQQGDEHTHRLLQQEEDSPPRYQDVVLAEIPPSPYGPGLSSGGFRQQPVRMTFELYDTRPNLQPLHTSVLMSPSSYPGQTGETPETQPETPPPSYPGQPGENPETQPETPPPSYPGQPRDGCGAGTPPPIYPGQPGDGRGAETPLPSFSDLQRQSHQPQPFQLPRRPNGFPGPPIDDGLPPADVLHTVDPNWGTDGESQALQEAPGPMVQDHTTVDTRTEAGQAALKNLIVEALIVTVCCFGSFPVGFMALVKAIDARSAVIRGDMQSARTSYTDAKKLIKLSIFIGIGCVLVAVVYGISEIKKLISDSYS